MSKRVIDLTDDELETLAGEAWQHAAHEALAKGLSVTGSRDGRRYRVHPDGRVEDLGAVVSETEGGEEPSNEVSRKGVSKSVA
ncbi:MAG: hypothetical protein WA418_22825 [Bradyrhizobium sp.]